MQPIIDFDDPCATAAAAIEQARTLAPILRNTLPALLGNNSGAGLAVIANRMNDVFSAFVTTSLETLSEDLEQAISRHTTKRAERYVARHIGGEEHYESRVVCEPDQIATELEAIRQEIRAILRLTTRTEALLAANRLIADRV